MAMVSVFMDGLGFTIKCQDAHPFVNRKREPPMMSSHAMNKSAYSLISETNARKNTIVEIDKRTPKEIRSQGQLKRNRQRAGISR